MGVANIDRKGAIGATRHIGRLLLRLSFSLGVLNLVWAFPKSVFSAEPAATTTVLVYNQAGVSPSILAAAEREAGRILGAAGVGVIWVECPMRSTTASAGGPCLRTLESTDIMLRVVPAPIQNSFKDNVFGFAVHPVLATVYYVDLAKRNNAEFEVPLMLGWVIAHELGHLLLGSNSHSSEGIMLPRWERKQIRQLMMRTLLFTPEQAKLMRAQARTRTKLQRGDPKDEFKETADQQVPSNLIP